MRVKLVIRTQGCGRSVRESGQSGSPGTWRRGLLKTEPCAPPTPRGPHREGKKNKIKRARRGQTGGNWSKTAAMKGGTHQGRSSTAQGPPLAGMTAGATAGSSRLPGGRQRPRPWRWVKTALGGPRPAAKMLPPLRSYPRNPQPRAKPPTAARRFCDLRRPDVTTAAARSHP